MLLKPLPFLLTAFVFFIQTLCRGQTPAPIGRLTNPDQLVKDMTFLNDVLKEAHPSLYRYTSKDSMDYFFAAALQKVNRPMNVRDFRLVVQPFVAKIRSGHTYISPSPDTYNPGIRFYFPFLVSVRNNRLIVYKALSKAYDQYVNHELLSVQDVPAAAILENVRAFISGEGYSNAYKDYKIQKSLAFINIMNEFYGSQPDYELVMKNAAGDVIRKTLKALSINEADTVFSGYFPKRLTSFEEMRSLAYPDTIPSAALLSLRSFNYKVQDGHAFYDNLFRELQRHKIRNLIIDLRGNTGGSFFSTIDIMRYLIPVPFQVIADDFAPVSTPTFMDNILQKDEIKNVPFVKRSKGGFSIKGSTQVYTPYKKLLFNGKIYLLTDGGTFSAASMFVSCLRANRLVTCVGEETGGMKTGLDTGPFSSVQLPNSKLVLHLPHFYTTLAVPQITKGAGIVPDVPVQPTIADLYSKTDPLLKKVKEIIRE